jgi:hypothetical protein
MAMMLQCGVVKQGFAGLLGVRWRKALLLLNANYYPLSMNGIEYAKILPKSLVNTFVDILDIAPQIRGSMNLLYGEGARDKSLYQSMTSAGIRLKGYKTSQSDEAKRDGFFESAEVFLETIADVASRRNVT